MKTARQSVFKIIRRHAVTLLAVAGIGASGLASVANPAAAANPAAKKENPCAAKNPLNPCSPGHIKARDALHGLAPAEAEKAYGLLKGKMGKAYRLSGIARIKGYQRWRRYNSAPYESSQHGDRYLNNYGNKSSQEYEKYEKIGKMSVGSVIAKDSFTILKDGRRLPGPLFVMEKMKSGFRPDFGDWKYSMILPDGSIVGETGGQDSANMDYCGACHAQVGETQDHLFFLPKDYRKAAN